MNASKALLSSALFIAAALTTVSAIAESNDNYPVLPKTKSSTTRAEVKAEAVKAEKAGDIIKNDDTYPNTKPSKTSNKTRAQVKAETKQAGVTGRIADSTYPAK